MQFNVETTYVVMTLSYQIEATYEMTYNSEMRTVSFDIGCQTVICDLNDTDWLLTSNN